MKHNDRKIIDSRRATHVAFGCALLLGPALGRAADGLAFDVNTGLGYSDNVRRAATDEQDETIATVGLKLSYDEQSSRVNARVVSDLAYYDYLQNSYDPDVVGTFLGNVDVALVQDRLNWFVNDSFGQVLSDPFVPATPDNREDINYLATGLDGKFGLGTRTRLDAKLTYALAMYQDLPLDSNTGIGEVGVTRLLAEGSTLGLNLRGAQVHYDDSAVSANDYDVREAALRYQLDGARTKFDLDAGYTKLERDDGTNDDGPLLRLNVVRALASRSTLTFEAGQEFANSAEAFEAHSAGGNVGLDNYVGRQTAAPFTRRYAGLGWDATGVRTHVAVKLRWDEQRYSGQPQLNESLGSIGGDVSRDLSAALSASLNAEWGKGNYEAAGGDYTESRLGFGLSWRFTRRVALALSYDHEKRDSDSTLNRYQENRIWLTVGYQRGAPSNSISRPVFGGDDGN